MHDGARMPVARERYVARSAARRCPRSSFPSEHPDPHPDLLRGEFGLELDDGMLSVLRTNVLNFATLTWKSSSNAS